MKQKTLKLLPNLASSTSSLPLSLSRSPALSLSLPKLCLLIMDLTYCELTWLVVAYGLRLPDLTFYGLCNQRKVLLFNCQLTMMGTMMMMIMMTLAYECIPIRSNKVHGVCESVRVCVCGYSSWPSMKLMLEYDGHFHLHLHLHPTFISCLIRILLWSRSVKPSGPTIPHTPNPYPNL